MSNNNTLNLPSAYANRVKTQLQDEYDNYIQALFENQPISVRLNNDKWNDKLPLSPVEWANSAYYLPERPNFTLDPLFQSGHYYVQEASSMFLEKVWSQLKFNNQPLKILDLCAAPGGKSTQILSLMSQNDLLISNEVIRQRAVTLSGVLKKWGNANVVVTNNDPSHFKKFKNYFDVIIADVPCSGEGLFRKDNLAVNEWSVENVKLCSERQRRILADIQSCLKPNGYLIYSTCTHNEDENEKNIDWYINEYQGASIPIELNKDWGVEEIVLNHSYVYKCWPHKVKGEGFAFSVVQKQDETLEVKKQIKPNIHTDFKLMKGSFAKDYHALITIDADIFQYKDGRFFAFPIDLSADFFNVKNNLNIVHAGVHIAETKGRDVIPTTDLALSKIANKNMLEIASVDINTALQYFKKEPVQINAHKGWVYLGYQNKIIGVVKNIGMRANNPLPNEWRIKMDIPAVIPQPFWIDI